MDFLGYVVGGIILIVAVACLIIGMCYLLFYGFFILLGILSIMWPLFLAVALVWVAIKLKIND